MIKASRPVLGAVIAEVFALRGAKMAAAVAATKGRHDLVEKIARGDFVAPRQNYNATRAKARAEAIRLIAAVEKSMADTSGGASHKTRSLLST